MANRVLPSREEATVRNVGLPLWAGSLVEAYASGRLVDREAINYEAAAKALAFMVHPFEVETAAPILTVAAALPDLVV